MQFSAYYHLRFTHSRSDYLINPGGIKSGKQLQSYIYFVNNINFKIH
ncbi:hypothetical protein BH11BAC5_BH11BAC5_53710 [soil metagenome]